jgi:deoxyribodipyrimidine photolyase-like uncharacterized protein
MNNFIIFPHQLFYNLDHLDGYKNIYLVEEPRYFTDFKFHKLKLAFHRASMKKYLACSNCWSSMVIQTMCFKSTFVHYKKTHLAAKVGFCF